MKGQRYFTDEELKEMGRRTLDVLIEAIDAGYKEKAKELAQRMYKEFNYLHDGYFTWVTGLQTYIYEKLGVDAVEEAERFAHTIESKIAFIPSGKTDFRERVIDMLGGLRGHLQPIEIKEDDEKVTLTMKPCGSGKRLIQKGGYEAGLARVREPHRITWGMKDFPLYCVHCPVMEALGIESTGDFAFCRFVSDPVGEEDCQFVFYKDPVDIPEEFYTRIDKKKPAV
ncbi:MAG TPA: hypothetical protein G4O16_02665 [Dehalococcoidia bacterium]|nr:hypothetical protein [Dehalococcoidia bacterium]